MILIEEMKIYILNTTRFYHEDFEEYPGAWFSCPVDFEEIRERLGVQSEEEIEIEDYELPFPLEGNTRLWEINALCRMVQEMQGTPLYYEMDVVQKRWFPSFTEFINHKDQIRCYPVQDGESLARYLVQEVQLFGEVHPDLLNHIDYAAIGRELEASENYLFTDNGIFSYRNLEEMRIYIANLGKYNEGELVGAWFTPPVDFEEVKERIGLNDEYEEYAIHDYELPFEIDEYTPIEEVNRLCEMVEDLPEHIQEELSELQSYFGSIEELCEHEDDIICHSGCDDMADVARYYLEESGQLGELPAHLQNYIDYAAYGRDMELEGTFVVTNHGVYEILR